MMTLMETGAGNTMVKEPWLNLLTFLHFSQKLTRNVSLWILSSDIYHLYILTSIKSPETHLKLGFGLHPRLTLGI